METTCADIIVQWCVFQNHQGQGRYLIWLHFCQDPACSAGVEGGLSSTCNTEQDCDREKNPCCTNHFRCLYHLLGVDALFDVCEGWLMAALKTHIYSVKAELFESFKFSNRFPQNIFRATVEVYSVHPRQIFPDTGKNLLKSGSRDDQGITISKKYPFLVLTIPGSKCNIIIYACSILNVKPNTFVCPTE